MIKNKFYKNLYQSISFFASTMLLVFALLWGYVSLLNYEKNNGWILLVAAVSLIIIFFIIGFYWMFQKVIINEEGIEICLFKKTIRKYAWNDVLSIEVAGIMRNPALRIKIADNSEVHLDKRKRIIAAIEYYSKKQII